jgi:hypothetical protein
VSGLASALVACWEEISSAPESAAPGSFLDGWLRARGGVREELAAMPSVAAKRNFCLGVLAHRILVFRQETWVGTLLALTTAEESEEAWRARWQVGR